MGDDLDRFWYDVQRASGYDMPDSVIDSPRLDAGSIETLLRGATLWLAPKVVAKFRPEGFWFLPAAEQARLADSVEAFRHAAEPIPWGEPATPAQVEAALPPFANIVALLEFDRFADPAAYRMGKQVEALIARRRPPELTELRFTTGRDHDGDPLLEIWSIVAEENGAFLRAVDRIRPLIDAAARETFENPMEYFPLQSFTTVSEQLEEVGES